MKKIAIFLVAFMCQIQLSKADDINSCISAALSLPLLGGKSDTPIIPVKVNGINVAMYVSPDFFGGLYMREGGNFSLRPGRIQGTITENDVRKFPAEVTSLEPDPKVFEQYQPVVIHPSLRRDGVNGDMDWYCPT